MLKLVEIEGNQIRFCVNHEKERKKLFTISNASTDISLAFHSYINADGTGKFISSIPISGQTFKVKDATFQDFKIHKFNFHKSGIGNIKNKTNERTGDDYQSIVIDKIIDATTLMVHQPTHFNKYPAINDSKKYYDLIQK